MASNLAIFDQGNFMAGAALINSAGPCATGNYGLYSAWIHSSISIRTPLDS